MKAKLYVLGKEQEIRLADGKQFFATENESNEEFVARVVTLVKEEYLEDVEIHEVLFANLNKYATDQLKTAYEKAIGVHAQMLKQILESRGVELEAKSEAKPLPEAVVKASKTAAKVVEEIKEKAPKGKAWSKSGTVEESTEASETPKAEKAPKVKKEKVAFEGYTAEQLADAKSKVGLDITFTSFKNEINLPGKITSIIVDKRTGRTYFRIRVTREDGSNKELMHVLITNPSIKIAK
jgi:hypothetical protein